MSDETKSTTIRMKPHTIAQVERLKKEVHAISFSDMIRKAVSISELVIDAAKMGNKILIEDKKGRQKQILISGIDGSFK